MTAPMEPLVDTLIEDARWEAFGLAALAEMAAAAALADCGITPAGLEISLLGCSDARIADLNADFRGKPQPTNVLSWPSRERGAVRDGDAPLRPVAGDVEMPEEMGDVAIAWETCAREAAEQGKEMRAHVTHLLVHGVLHLLGYDHMRPKDAEAMESREVRILAKLGLAGPYQ
jgi:probable rRNA maturation factor